MNRWLLAGVAASAICAAGITPASARLQLSIQAGASVFTCFDGQAGCDSSPGANNLLVVDHTVGGVLVEVTLAQSAFGKPDELQLSSSNIENLNSGPVLVKLLASDNNFLPPVKEIKESGSLTFNNAVGSAASSLQFWADPLNVQGANPTNHPGTLLDTVTGTPTTNPDSFSGTKFSVFDATSKFSMTEGANLNLIGGGSITGFNQAMQTIAVPEASTWVMMAGGFGLIALMAGVKRRTDRLASI